jgi:hypothetical protein
MGFGSYDESEQENQEINTNFEDEEGMNTSEHDHSGQVEYEFGDTDSDDLLNQLKDIKDSQQEEQGS